MAKYIKLEDGSWGAKVYGLALAVPKSGKEITIHKKRHGLDSRIIDKVISRIEGTGYYICSLKKTPSSNSRYIDGELTATFDNA